MGDNTDELYDDEYEDRQDQREENELLAEQEVRDHPMPREMRLGVIRRYVAQGLPYNVEAPQMLDDVGFLLAEAEWLSEENEDLRLAAVQDEGLWSSQDAGLRAEIARLTAERDALAVPRVSEIQRLESAVLGTALAERRASLALKGRRNGSGPFGAAQAWTDALAAHEAACTALLKYLGGNVNDQ